MRCYIYRCLKSGYNFRMSTIESTGLKRTANDIYFARFWHENLIIDAYVNKIFNPRIQRLGENYVALEIYWFKSYIFLRGRNPYKSVGDAHPKIQIKSQRENNDGVAQA